MIEEGLRAKNIIGSTAKVMNKMSGTTGGQVYTLAENEEPQYVLKFDNQIRNIFVKKIYQTYSQSILLPKLLYCNDSNEFIVYTFIPGKTHNNRGLKKNWLARLVEHLLNHYKISQNLNIWGSVDRPYDSWREFIERKLNNARRNIGDILPIEDYNRVQSLIERISKVDYKYLIHGDAGVHNFVFCDYELVGVIDPWPIVGPMTYDFTYAFCSSPDDLTMETLFDAYDLLKDNKMEKSRLIDEVVFQLYCRIGVCAKFHPHDLQDYLKAWEYWKVPPHM
ncbi:hypothetical protein CJP46_25915 [Paenibacillus sp. XY044]|nr:hypothetical protein CJP46_25915 [Paenibacillus sp. XY044]